MNRRFDVIIVGAGPAGIFTSLELANSLEGLRIVMLEKGSNILERMEDLKGYDTQPGHWSAPFNCGWGGAGAFSDGKLTLSTEVGGFLSRYVGETRGAGLIDQVDRYYVSFGAPDEIFGEDGARINALRDRALRHDLQLVSTRIRHMGSDRCTHVLRNLWNDLHERVEIRFKTPVARVLVEDGKIRGAETEAGDIIDGTWVRGGCPREGRRRVVQYRCPGTGAGDDEESRRYRRAGRGAGHHNGRACRDLL